MRAKRSDCIGRNMIDKKERGKVGWKPRRLQEPDERMTVFDDESDEKQEGG